jgi:hypothetical protein
MGTKTVLDGAPGAVVVDEHCGRFSSAVVELLQDPARRAALSVKASAFIAERWSSEEMARRMLDLYRQLLEPTGREALHKSKEPIRDGHRASFAVDVDCRFSPPPRA